MPGRRQGRDVGLPYVDGQAGRAQAVGEVGLERCLVARDEVGPGRARVERDEPREQVHQRIAAALDLGGDAPLERARCLGHSGLPIVVEVRAEVEHARAGSPSRVLRGARAYTRESVH
jgi:hypothetical protein